jgi:ribosomal protein S18 acetylase RimI-like enzyme
MTIERVVSGPTVQEVRVLLREYADGLGVDLCFQDFESELLDLPGGYQAPHGVLFLCRDGGEPAGCVAIRRWDSDTAEMKRLYVRNAYRGRRYGAALTDRALAFSREARYRRVVLDTLPSMTEALRLYAALGFREIPPYRPNPIEGARFLELTL